MAHLSGFDRLVARRFSGGLTPDLASDIKAAGGGRAWFVQQLKPGNVGDPRGAEVDGWFPSLVRTPEQIFTRQQDDTQGAWEVMSDLSRWTVARRIHSKRQLQEVMVDFWSNLLNVALMDDDAMFYRVDYDRTIRTYALTSFEQLLQNAITHPAMSLFLDNAVSTKANPNENLGRELLELHTVGIDAGYTETDVKQSSKLLTGFRVDLWWPRFQAFYDTNRHFTGPIEVMGFSSPNIAADGRDAVASYLSYLARHPATAQRIARRLCVRFVSDTPSPALVAAVAAAYSSNGTAIKPTLTAMVDHPEFAASAGKRIRTPIEDYVATVRALQIQLQRPTSDQSFANAMYWQYVDQGNAPYEWPAPNGYPEVGAAWTSAGRLLGSLSLHETMAGGWWPTEQALFKPLRSWLPPLPATLDSVVDYVGRQVLSQPVPPAIRQGVSTQLGIPLTKTVRRRDLDSWRMVQMLATLLDSPTHMHR